MAVKIKSHPDEPEKDLELFKNQQENNERIFKEMLRNHRKDVFVLMNLLDQTGINYYVIFQIIRHLNNIALGGKWGEVKIFIENGVVVRNRSNQPLCENCLRISIGTKEETEQIIELLKTFNNAEKSIIYR